MIINFTPYPEVKIILKSFFSKLSLGRSWNNHNQNITFYSRATWALYDAITHILISKGKKNGVVWFPSYFCNEPLQPLRKKGITLKFYPILRSLQPDWNFIENKLISNKSIDVFVLVHYFGFIFPIEKAIKFCNKHKIILIEDGAHILKKQNNLNNNISIYSLRKTLSLPEIGILVSNNSISNNYHKNNFIFFKWLIKQITQKIFSILHINWYYFSSNRNINSENYFNLNQKFPSRLSIKLLNIYEKKLNIYGEIRRKNYLNFEKSINGINNIEPLFKMLPNGSIPYVFPLIVKKNYYKIKNKLKKMGIPATSWSDMPPEVESLFNRRDYGFWLSKHLLLFPIHHSLKTKEINYIVSCLKEIIKNIN